MGGDFVKSRCTSATTRHPRFHGGGLQLEADLDELAQLTTVGGNLTIRVNLSLEPALAYALLDRLLAHGFSGEVDIFRNGDADDGHD